MEQFAIPDTNNELYLNEDELRALLAQPVDAEHGDISNGLAGGSRAAEQTSYLDDMFTTGFHRPELLQASCGAPEELQGPFDLVELEPEQNADGSARPELLFQAGGTSGFSFADSDVLSSSLNSTTYSDWARDSVSSASGALMHPSSNSFTNSYLSSSVRSPSTRTGNLGSSSLRNSNGFVPRVREHSMSSSVNDALASASVSKSLSQMTADEKLRRKREFHNAVERRRRELIKQKIKELGKLVPPSLLNYDVNGHQVKLNKGIILNKTQDYISYLSQVLEIQARKKKLLLIKINELKESLGIDQINEARKITDLAVEADNAGSIDPLSREVQLDYNKSHSYIEDSINSKATDKTAENLELPLSESKQALGELDQFLSGDLVEAEDNAQLIFNTESSNPADYLLEFET